MCSKKASPCRPAYPYEKRRRLTDVFDDERSERVVVIAGAAEGVHLHHEEHNFAFQRHACVVGGRREFFSVIERCVSDGIDEVSHDVCGRGICSLLGG